MATAFGPQGPNYSTTRPTNDAEASAGVDTWAVNCTAAGAKNGTFFTADFFNVIIGNLRYAVRTANVPMDSKLDTMLYDAIRAIALDVFNAEWRGVVQAAWGIEISADSGKIELTVGKGVLAVVN